MEQFFPAYHGPPLADQFHLQQNAQSSFPTQGIRKKVASRIRAISNAPSRKESERLLEIFIEDYRKILALSSL
ncbi:MAG: hypothetical protein DRG59_02060 [Deltaproteobacteria bacterium]|nr:MAG: hypothetical protein DRG83_02805 [Deltaproteobacteria bacterium]RLB09538.1 MAG: hypothetical protein DRG59_02060 [Deltaproteobacteria bacterium]